MAVLTTAEKLAEAKDALHALMIGVSARVVVDQNQERVEYTAINRAGLVQYIETLEAQLAVENGTCRPRGPAGVRF